MYRKHDNIERGIKESVLISRLIPQTNFESLTSTVFEIVLEVIISHLKLMYMVGFTIILVDERKPGFDVVVYLIVSSFTTVIQVK